MGGRAVGGEIAAKDLCECLLWIVLLPSADPLISPDEGYLAAAIRTEAEQASLSTQPDKIPPWGCEPPPRPTADTARDCIGKLRSREAAAIKDVRERLEESACLL